jgi:prepilin-type N-terminal cleavage/methylation domain-containing protein
MMFRPTTSSMDPSRRAFSLVECLVALVIVAMAAAAASTAIGSGIAAQEDALRITLAAACAESRMTQALTTDYASAPGLAGNEAPGALTAVDGTAMPGLMSEMGRRTTVDAEPQSIPGFAGLVLTGWQITVTVYDIDGDGDERELAVLRRFRPQTWEETQGANP